MAVNNYLIIGVNPANNETSVSTDKDIVITFSQYMDQATLTSTNLVLKEVNGALVPYTMTYSTDGTITATINPTDNLKTGTEYQLDIIGTSNGVKTITGDYMDVTRSYQFITTYNVPLSVPTNVETSVGSGFVTVTWGRPVDYDPSLALSYDVMISESVDPLQAPIWPSTGDVNRTAGTILNVPKKLSDGNYYAYVRAVNDNGVSVWTSVQFVVQTASVITPPSGGGTNTFSFDVADTYPRRNDADITPEQIVIIFSSNVDAATVTADSIYLIKKQDKTSLSLVDFMTDYAPSKKVAATIAPIVTPNIVTLTATLENDAEYTVIVRESVADTLGTTLGVAYHWSFTTTYSRLYGDASLVRQDLGSTSDMISDKLLYGYLSDSSEYAYQLASSAANFVASNYADGKAPYEIHQYVRFRTAYDLLLNSQLRSGGGGFTSDVTLGDLHVKKQADASGSVSGILSDLQNKMKLYLDMIQGLHNRGYAKLQVVIRGENIETYPAYMTRDTYKDLGQ